MGYSLSFYPIDGDDLRADDRAQITAFLESRGLAVDPDTHGLYRVADGVALSFDGAWTDLELDPLDQSEPLTGSLSHATLTEAECAFVFALCAAGGLMIVNPQGEPMYLGIRGVHTAEMFPDPDDAVLIGSPAELASVLEGSFGEFREYLGRIPGI